MFDEPDGSITEGPLEANTIWIIYDADNNDGRGMRNIQMKFKEAIAQSDYLFTVDGSCIYVPEQSIERQLQIQRQDASA
ncbi:hypothetical protein HYY72_01860 [Candidatus Woesearchaeota archaeon]|nr:hypothetical protein [Candidatus Woesearchaeota archaeon]